MSAQILALGSVDYRKMPFVRPWRRVYLRARGGPGVLCYSHHTFSARGDTAGVLGVGVSADGESRRGRDSDNEGETQRRRGTDAPQDSPDEVPFYSDVGCDFSSFQLLLRSHFDKTQWNE